MAKEPTLYQACDLALEVDLVVEPGLHFLQLLLQLAHLVDLNVNLGLLNLLESSFLVNLGFWSPSLGGFLHEVGTVALNDYNICKKIKSDNCKKIRLLWKSLVVTRRND